MVWVWDWNGKCDGWGVGLEWECDGLGVGLEWECDGLGVGLEWECDGLGAKFSDHKAKLNVFGESWQ